MRTKSSRLLKSSEQDLRLAPRQNLETCIVHNTTPIYEVTTLIHAEETPLSGGESLLAASDPVLLSCTLPQVRAAFPLCHARLLISAGTGIRISVTIIQLSLRTCFHLCWHRNTEFRNDFSTLSTHIFSCLLAPEHGIPHRFFFAFCAHFLICTDNSPITVSALAAARGGTSWCGSTATAI